MCAGAMLHARLKRVVFGAADPKTGAAWSMLNLFAQPQLNHQTQVQGGVLATECGALLQQFFKRQRAHQTLHGSPLRDDALRTPSTCFDAVPDLPGAVVELADLPSLAGLRLHYVDAGPTDAATVYLCLHSAQSWSQQWRSFMLEQAGQGQRVLALDLIGFGKSDKPKKPSFHTLAWHAQVIMELLQRLNLSPAQHLVLVEPTEGAYLCQPDGATLADQLMQAMSPRLTERQLHPADALTPAVLKAPYPDAGHRAALRALGPLHKP